MITHSMTSASKWFLAFAGAACIAAASVFAASPNPALVKAKQEAETKGYTFLSTRDEIVAEAKKEGKLRVLGSMTSTTYKFMMEAFKKRYPFIEVSVEDLRDNDAHKRTQLELKARRTIDWDLCYVVI